MKPPIALLSRRDRRLQRDPQRPARTAPIRPVYLRCGSGRTSPPIRDGGADAPDLRQTLVGGDRSTDCRHVHSLCDSGRCACGCGDCAVWLPVWEPRTGAFGDDEAGKGVADCISPAGVPVRHREAMEQSARPARQEMWSRSDDSKSSRCRWVVHCGLSRPC